MHRNHPQLQSSVFSRQLSETTYARDLSTARGQSWKYLCFPHPLNKSGGMHTGSRPISAHRLLTQTGKTADQTRSFTRL
jgi:hypothetical protein